MRRGAVAVGAHEELPPGDAPRELVRDRDDRRRYRDDALNVDLEARREDRVAAHGCADQRDLERSALAQQRLRGPQVRERRPLRGWRVLGRLAGRAVIAA